MIIFSTATYVHTTVAKHARQAAMSAEWGRVAILPAKCFILGEEEQLQPAHAIFFSGCTATCSFCTAAKFAFDQLMVSPSHHDNWPLAWLNDNERVPVRSVFIGGDPTPHIPFILDTIYATLSMRWETANKCQPSSIVTFT